MIQMNKALAELIKISNTVGKNVSLVQAGGGNVSVKTNDRKYMYIKASGAALKDMTEKTGWRQLNLNSVLSIITDKQLFTLNVDTREDQVINRLFFDACFFSRHSSFERNSKFFTNRCKSALKTGKIKHIINHRFFTVKIQSSILRQAVSLL